MRIIAGQWRGRKLTFPDGHGLRPTSDRIRETLFNWLAPAFPGVRCLDLFAGSGALGFEAASRGAAQVIMVEKNPVAVQMLIENKQRLAAEAVEIVLGDALQYLAGINGSFDVVFLDPPFNDPQLRDSAVQMLVRSGCLRLGSYIYLETPKQAPEPVVPADWTPAKCKTAGQVTYRLYRYEAPATH